MPATIPVEIANLGGMLLFPCSDNAGIDDGLVFLHVPESKTPRGCQDGSQARLSVGSHLTLPPGRQSAGLSDSSATGRPIRVTGRSIPL